MNNMYFGTCIESLGVDVEGIAGEDLRKQCLAPICSPILLISSFIFYLIKLQLISSEYFVGLLNFPFAVLCSLGNHQSGEVQWFSLSFTGTQDMASENVYLLYQNP